MMRIKLSQKEKFSSSSSSSFSFSPLIGTNQEIKESKDWLRSFDKKFEDSNVKELMKSYSDPKYTHAGLIYYFHLCWSKEKGACLRPDMIWYTIVSEISRDVLNHPDQYCYLFSDSKEKTNIVQIVDDMETMNVDILTKDINKLMKNKEFGSLICDTTFDSQPKLANCAIKMCFAYMATPYFNYITTLCGIPHLDIKGTYEEWTKLLGSILELGKYPPKEKNLSDYFENYLNNCLNTVKLILYYRFKIDSRLISESNYESSDQFFNDIFYYGKNTKCGSGHDHNIVYGWIKNFYMGNKDEKLKKYNTHINYVPYKNIDSNRMFFQACGLVYSTEEDNTLLPEYGMVKYEIFDQTLYLKLANIKEEIHPCCTCDGCGIKPIKGLRYKCSQCINFDFCEKCYTTNPHAKEHKFNIIKADTYDHDF